MLLSGQVFPVAGGNCRVVGFPEWNPVLEVRCVGPRPSLLGYLTFTEFLWVALSKELKIYQRFSDSPPATHSPHTT